MKVIGLTGGMASGKTRVAGLFRDLGARIIDADQVVSNVLKQTSVKKKLRLVFGQDILASGKVDREKLADRSFGSKKGLKKLCDIIHPPVIQAIMKHIGRAKCGVTVVDAPLLIESGLHKQMDFVIVLKATRKTQIMRSLRKGFRREDAFRRIKAQMPLSRKLKYADFVIDNDGTISSAKAQVADIWNRLRD